MSDRIARIPRTVVHLAKHDPDEHVGGVSAFARNLRLVFEEVVMFSAERQDWARVGEQRLPVICDNQWVSRAPRGVPVIGFQHGVAEVKRRVTRSLTDYRLAWQQRRAARRPNTLWVACAQWISEASERHYGNSAAVVVRHPVDLERFDGRLDNAESRLILHDARSLHKGQRLVALLQRACPEWRFEPLQCAPDQVPDRLRSAAAFVHLSRYEGNSIVCNEAMAQGLPCLFTRVGLMQDADGPDEVTLLDPDRAFTDPDYLIDRTRSFLGSLSTWSGDPRRWILEHTQPAANRRAWEEAMHRFDALPWPRALS